MEYLRGCSVVQAIGHEVPYLGVGWRSRVRIAEIDETRDRIVIVIAGQAAAAMINFAGVLASDASVLALRGVGEPG
jgi:hypothetical protein